MSLVRTDIHRQAGYEFRWCQEDVTSENTELPLCTPDPRRVAASQMVAFRDAANTRFGLSLRTYRELHAWSVAYRPEFWDLVWDFTKVVGEKGARLVIDGVRRPGV